MESDHLVMQNYALLGHLHSDLRDYMDDEPSCEINHPLITVSLYFPITTEQIDKINAQYSYIKDLADEAIEEKRFSDYIGLIQRGYRLSTFADEVIPLLTDQQYWELLAYIWIETEFPHQCYDLWRELFASKRPHRQALMTEEEQIAFAAMARTLTVYRGGPTANGLSWTLSEDKARYFANRFNRNNENKIFQGTVSKNKVYAYLRGKNEEEIVVQPKFVTLE